jgi:hypothetical protein
MRRAFRYLFHVLFLGCDGAAPLLPACGTPIRVYVDRDSEEFKPMLLLSRGEDELLAAFHAGHGLVHVPQGRALMWSRAADESSRSTDGGLPERILNAVWPKAKTAHPTRAGDRKAIKRDECSAQWNSRPSLEPTKNGQRPCRHCKSANCEFRHRDCDNLHFSISKSRIWR